MADRIRDFRESVAVLEAIKAAGKPAVFPVTGHILKIGIPKHLVTDKVIDLGSLSSDDQIEGIKLSNLLVNINREVQSLLCAINKNELASFYLQVDELAKKLRSLSKSWKASHPALRIKDPSTTPKRIIFTDGTEVFGSGYDLASESTAKAENSAPPADVRHP